MDLKICLLFIVISFLTVSGLPHKRQSGPVCGYDACPELDPDKYHIHLIAHTHDDVGWLKTVQQYYYGIVVPGVTDQRAGVQYILDTVVRQLKEDPNRRFIYVETAFFWIWWNKQTPQMQESVKELVNSGRLEFISGGWSMNDEATVHYQPVIDQMTWGHRRLQDIFGKCAITKIGWQIDPFGHSREYASLTAQMYFDGLFFSRLDYDDKSARMKDKRMEFLWKSSKDLGPTSDMFTGVLPMGYGAPRQFCFDDLCSDAPIVDDPNSEEYNVEKKVNTFLEAIEGYAKGYSTNHFITTFGEDFQYQNALIHFKNIDLLIKYVNERQKSGSKYNLLYSTPTCYLKALHDSNRTWTTKSDDFFPYASDPHAFWTGYFTSRPAFKLQERKSNAILQSCKGAQLWLDATDQETEDAVSALREAMGIAQHHDAVAGTEKQHVAKDYALQLSKGVLKCQEVIRKAFIKNTKSDVFFCPALNVSQCEFVEKEDNIAVVLYNLRSQPVSRQIAIPWSNEAYVIKNEKGEIVPSDLIPITEIIKGLPERKANTTHEIFFTGNITPNMGATYYIERKPNIGSPQLRPEAVPDEGLELEGQDFTILFNSEGIVGVRRGNEIVKVKQSFLYYRGMNGDNKVDHGRWNRRASGAYIFRPNGTAAVPFPQHKAKPVFVNGSVVKEFRQQINNWITQTIRVSKDSKFVEFDYVVGPIPIADEVGKEIISRFETDIKNGKIFYTDANGRQLVERVRDHRDTWDYNPQNEPVSGNYYPVNSRIIIKDEKADLQLTVLTDRSQGGSSMAEGAVELMVHRRLLHDDAFGVGEALNEPGIDGKGLIIRGSHKIFIGSIKESVIHRDQGMTEFLEPQIYFQPFKTIEEHVSLSKGPFAVADNPPKLPPNIHLLTVESWKGKVLIRLEHFYESTDDPDNLSKPVTVSLKKMFNVKGAIETTLTATEELSEATRFKWKTADGIAGGGYESTLNPKDFTVTLKPMEIRTFIIWWK